MNILFLGGNRYFGKSVLRELLKKKNIFIYLVNRNSKKEKFKNSSLKYFCCNRKDLHKFKSDFEKIFFDVVFDNIAYKLKDVKNLHKLLKGRIKHYVFTSSVMTYLNLNYHNEIKEKSWDKKKSIKGMIDKYEPEQIKYALNKEKIEKYLLKNKNIKATILRIHNVIGKNDFKDITERLLSYSFKEKKEANISGQDFIQFCFEKDLVKVILKIFNKRVNRTSAYNVSNKKIKIKNFFSKLNRTKYISKRKKKQFTNTSFPLPTNVLMNCNKIEKKLSIKFSSIDRVLNTLPIENTNN